MNSSSFTKKRLLASTLTLSMALSMATPVFAETLGMMPQMDGMEGMRPEMEGMEGMMPEMEGMEGMMPEMGGGPSSGNTSSSTADSGASVTIEEAIAKMEELHSYVNYEGTVGGYPIVDTTQITYYSNNSILYTEDQTVIAGRTDGSTNSDGSYGSMDDVTDTHWMYQDAGYEGYQPSYQVLDYSHITSTDGNDYEKYSDYLVYGDL